MFVTSFTGKLILTFYVQIIRMSSSEPINVQEEEPQPGTSSSGSTGRGGIKRKPGRKSADLWSFFTDDVNPHTLISAKCKHCKLTINHHRKSEYAKKHLLKCLPFKKNMFGKPQEDRPDWFPSKKHGLQSSDNPQNQTRDQSDETQTKPTPSEETTKTKQATIKSFGIPLMSKSDLKKFQTNLAMFFYKTGTSFVRVEDEHLAKSYKICRPDAVLPTRKELATVFLDSCYNQIKTEVLKDLAEHICIVTDAWTNVNGDPVVNYMATSPKGTYFLESVNTGAQGHTGQWIAEDISRVIDNIETRTPSTKVAGVVTDNAAANKLAWNILEKKYPKKFFHGCVCHCLNLLVKDIFEDNKQKTNVLPLGELPAFINKCKDLVVFFKNHHVQNHELRLAQKIKKVERLVLPAKTRWSTTYNCLKSILASEDILHTMVHARDFIAGSQAQREIKEAIKDTISNENFVVNLKKGIFILEKITVLTTKFQGDNVPISEVYFEFLELPKYFESIDAKQHLTDREINFIKNAVNERFQFIYGDAHGLGYLLDPRFSGYGMETTLKEELEDFIVKYDYDIDGKEITEEQQELVFRELTNFRLWAQDQKERNTFRYQMLIKGKKTTMEFWKLEGTEYPNLRKLALQIFSMCVSSASAERNFSTFGFVHSKLRNRLAEERIEKLVFVKTNGNILSKFEESEGEDSEASEDFCDVVEELNE